MSSLLSGNCLVTPPCIFGVFSLIEVSHDNLLFKTLPQDLFHSHSPLNAPLEKEITFYGEMGGFSDSITIAFFFLASVIAGPVEPQITAAPLVRRALVTVGWYADGTIGDSTICMLERHS